MERNPRGRPRHPDVLTPAEWRVLEELREGGTNAEIASRLGISGDAVKYHISNMLGKLELRDRRALAAWRPERRRGPLRAGRDSGHCLVADTSAGVDRRRGGGRCRGGGGGGRGRGSDGVALSVGMASGPWSSRRPYPSPPMGRCRRAAAPRRLQRSPRSTPTHDHPAPRRRGLRGHLSLDGRDAATPARRASLRAGHPTGDCGRALIRAVKGTAAFHLLTASGGRSPYHYELVSEHSNISIQGTHLPYNFDLSHATGHRASGVRSRYRRRWRHRRDDVQPHPGQPVTPSPHRLVCFAPRRGAGR